MLSLIDQDSAKSVIVLLRSLAGAATSIYVAPSLTYIIGRHAHAKHNGTGEIVIGGEVNKLLPRATAANIHPLHTKAALFVRLPIHWLDRFPAR